MVTSGWDTGRLGDVGQRLLDFSKTEDKFKRTIV
jgi:hypothetical protein